MAKTDLKSEDNFVDWYDDEIDNELSTAVPGVDDYRHATHMSDAIAYDDKYEDGELNFGVQKEQFKIFDRSGHTTKESGKMTQGKRSERAYELSDFLKQELTKAGFDIGDYDDEEE